MVLVAVVAVVVVVGLDLGVGCFLGTVGSMDVFGCCESDGAMLRLRLVWLAMLVWAFLGNSLFLSWGKKRIKEKRSIHTTL